MNTETPVYVVPLRDARPEWASLAWVEFVEDRRRYFHPTNKRNFPKEPVAWLGFRFRGQLLGIYGVESCIRVECRSELQRHIPEIDGDAMRRAYDDGRVVPHFLYTLAEPIRPQRPIPTGKPLYGPGHHWIDLDLLLTSASVAEAWDLMKQRRRSAGR